MNRSKTPITRSVSVPLICWKCTVSSQTMIRFFSVFHPKSLQLFLLSQHIRQKGLYTGSLTISLRRYSKCITVYDGSSGEFTIFLFPYFFIFPLLPDLFTSLLFLIWTAAVLVVCGAICHTRWNEGWWHIYCNLRVVLVVVIFICALEKGLRPDKNWFMLSLKFPRQKIVKGDFLKRDGDFRAWRLLWRCEIWKDLGSRYLTHQILHFFQMRTEHVDSLTPWFYFFDMAT